MSEKQEFASIQNGCFQSLEVTIDLKKWKDDIF